MYFKGGKAIDMSDKQEHPVSRTNTKRGVELNEDSKALAGKDSAKLEKVASREELILKSKDIRHPSETICYEFY